MFPLILQHVLLLFKPLNHDICLDFSPSFAQIFPVLVFEMSYCRMSMEYFRPKVENEKKFVLLIAIFYETWNPTALKHSNQEYGR